MGVSTVVRFNAGPQGTALSVANAGLSTAPVLNGGAAYFDTAAAGEGTYGATFDSVAGLIAIADVPMQATSTAGQSTSTEITFHTPTATPNVDSTLFQLRNAAGGGLICTINYSTTGVLYVQPRSPSGAVTIATSIPLNTQYDLALVVYPGTATTAPFDGQFNCILYLHSTRAVVGTASSATVNLTTSQPDTWRLGVNTVLTGVAKHKYDTCRAETNRTTVLGVYTPPANNPPVVPAILDQTVPVGSGTTFTAAATDTDGSVAATGGYSWVVKSYPGGAPPGLSNTANATVTVGATPTTGIVVLGVTATDNGGAPSAERTVNLFVTAAAGTTVGADKVISNPGNYGYGGTATDLVDGLTNSGEWIITPTGPTGATITVGFPPFPDNDVTIDYYVDLVKADGTTLADVGQTGTATAQLCAGTTAISDIVNSSISRTEVHGTITLTPAQNTAFTSAGRTDPRLVITISAS